MEKEIEQAIQAKGLNAPRLTPKDIDAVIVDYTFTTLPSGKVMVCEITLVNGFTVRGEAATVSKENFNEEISKTISLKNAREKIWELEGYLLQERISKGNV
jgi:Phage protein (N4 Gp49/phage Sf6 gene 66) family